MTKNTKKDPSVTTNLEPTRRDRFLPAELLGISGGLGIFAGLIVLISTREFILAGITLGLAFILSLVLMALFALAFKPTAAEAVDIEEQDAEARAKMESRASEEITPAEAENDAGRPGADTQDGDSRGADTQDGGTAR